jgi:hypothetical protein
VDKGLVNHETIKKDTEVGNDEWLKTPMEIEFVQDDQDEWSTVGGSAGHEQWIKATSEQETKLSMDSSSWSYYYMLQEEQEEEEVSLQDDDRAEQYQDNALTSFDLMYSEVDSQDYMDEEGGEESGEVDEAFLSN